MGSCGVDRNRTHNDTSPALAPQPHWELVVFPTRTATSNGSTRLLMNVGVSIPLGGRRRR